MRNFNYLLNFSKFLHTFLLFYLFYHFTFSTILPLKITAGTAMRTPCPENGGH